MSKRQLTSNEKSFPKFKKAHNIRSERRDDDQSVNKDILLNILIKFKFYKNRRDLNFINEDNFDQHTSQSFIQNYNSRKKNNMNLNSFLQDFDEQEKEIINVKSSSQAAISKAKMNDFSDEKTI